MGTQGRSKWTAPEPQPGAPVVTDTGMTGTITEVLPDFPDGDGSIRVAWDGAQSTVVPRRALRIERDRILVRTDAGTEATAQTEVVSGEDEIVVPVVEERVVTETPWRDAGAVRLRVRTEEAPQTVTAAVAREELDIEEVAIGRVLADGEAPALRQEGETLIVPVIEERLVTVKQRVLAREVHITKRIRTETREVTETVRQQRVEIAEDDLANRVHQHGTSPAKGETSEEGVASST
jgi:uncharacterized protein (TIGR02271 family)